MTGGMSRPPKPFDADYRELLVSRATRYTYDYDSYEGCSDFDAVTDMLRACLEELGRGKAEKQPSETS